MQTILLTKTGGIYAITNMVNGHQYVGSAGIFTNRWKQHRFHLNRGDHHCQHLQRAWKRYGPASFTFTVLEAVEQIDELFAREQFYLDALKPAYNAQPHACVPRGTGPSPQCRAATAEANRRRVYTPAMRENLRRAHQEVLDRPGHLAKVGHAISAGLLRYYASHPDAMSKERREKIRAGNIRTKGKKSPK